jgi:hypothetical protein
VTTQIRTPAAPRTAFELTTDFHDNVLQIVNDAYFEASRVTAADSHASARIFGGIVALLSG